MSELFRDSARPRGSAKGLTRCKFTGGYHQFWCFFSRADLTERASRPYRMGMAQTYMIFDFGTNEELAQQARHKIEGWKQGFRLGEKMSMKFERIGAEIPPDGGKPAKKGKEGKEAADHVTVLVRLAFSDHEKLSYQRWIDRIPGIPASSL